MNKFISTFVFLISILLGNAQTENDAKQYYILARDQFNNAEYNSCLINLKKAQDILKSEPPNIIYLKANCYHKLSNGNIEAYIDSTINICTRFLNQQELDTDTENFRNITLIKGEAELYKNKLKEKEYATYEKYLKLLNSNSITEIDNFLNENPEYKNENYGLQKRKNQILLSNSEKEAFTKYQNLKEELDTYYYKKGVKKALSITGGVGALFISTAIIRRSRGKTGDLNMVLAISGGFASMCDIAWFMPNFNKKIRRVSDEMYKIKKVYPNFSLHLNSYGVSFAFNF